jgi:hypothetical protein
MVADGEFLHVYESTAHWHYRLPIALLPGRMIEGLATGSQWFRRLPGSIDEYVERGKDGTGHPDFHTPDAWRAGTDAVLGYEVEVIETTPSWSNGEFRTSGGVNRYWIEPNHLLIVKSTTEGNDGSEQRASTITSLSFDAEVGPEELEFRPPDGSCDMGEGMPRRPDEQIPSGVQDPEKWLRKQKCGPVE